MTYPRGEVDVLVLQHIACEPPGVYEDVLDERGATLRRVELDEGEPLPDWRRFDAIVAMGGPMSVNDESELPWLAAEKQTIGEAVRAGTPFWGACLGVQLLAASLGARVYAGQEPEVGVMPVTLTDEARADPVFAGLPDGSPLAPVARRHVRPPRRRRPSRLLGGLSEPGLPLRRQRVRGPVPPRGLGRHGARVGCRPRVRGVRSTACSGTGPSRA